MDDQQGPSSKDEIRGLRENDPVVDFPNLGELVQACDRCRRVCPVSAEYLAGAVDHLCAECVQEIKTAELKVAALRQAAMKKGFKIGL